MKHFTIILLVILNSFLQKEKVNEQNYIDDYYQNIYKADLEYMTENYEKAFELYQSAFYSCVPINTQMYYEISNFAETCAILKKDDLALVFMKKKIANGSTLESMQRNSNFDNVFASEGGKELIANYDTLRKEYLSSLNLDLRQEIAEMKANDQKYRAQAGFMKSDEMKAKQEEIDDYNTKRLIEIFDDFGYPNEKVIGGFNIDKTPVSIDGILLHTSDSIRVNYFIPKLKEYIKKGECSPSVLGPVIDQYYLYNGEPQVNGTYTKPDGSYSNMITNLEKVNENRISIGLPPIWLQEKKDSLTKAKYGY
ncbi:hypothetical protein [uncultured Winogradskyella sp.]|uniref:hypothetical protein n=1 Tax=uncultured Winogradskyella sp. TaxID=395353 RepID=UPI002632DDE4|nr:hypothetical protein [uncultured Winogradskyella sp.]